MGATLADPVDRGYAFPRYQPPLTRDFIGMVA
jgi:hypothetical protein